MRLCKEDNKPDAVLCRRVQEADGTGVEGPASSLCVPALPTADGSISELANEVPGEIRGEPCLFQGSVGTAYNLKSL